MAEWMLILALGAGYGVALTNVPMQSKEACEAAGKQAEQSKLNAGLKSIYWTCVRTR